MNAKPLRSKEISKWADSAMYDSEGMPFDVNTYGPQVTLLSMTPDPLGAVAAMSMMYEGKVVRNLADLTNDQRMHYFEQITKTHLKAPFESVQLHFLIEGVTRSFTHQMVRQRTAVFAQESLRFAVKDTIDEEVALPPSLRLLKKDDPKVVLWKTAVNKTDDVYHALIDGGIPAEDARGLLPHNITTRLHYVTNLRALQEHAGMRLCTQAQFEWRTVWMRMVEAIAAFDPMASALRRHETMEYSQDGSPVADSLDRWQFKEIAGLFRPVCYNTGKCEFLADFDRKCKIRNRVDANHAIGRDSSEWDQEYDKVEDNPIVVGLGPQSVILNETGQPVFIGAIKTIEWLNDPTAAR